MSNQVRREINGVRAIFEGGEDDADEYLCVKEIAVVALFGGVSELVEALHCDSFLGEV